MSNKLSWRDALKQFNDDRIKEGGKYSIPKKGTPEYATVRKLMGDDIDAVELKPNQTITGQDPPAPVKQTRAKVGRHLNKNLTMCQLRKNHNGSMSLSPLPKWRMRRQSPPD